MRSGGAFLAGKQIEEACPSSSTAWSPSRRLVRWQWFTDFFWRGSMFADGICDRLWFHAEAEPLAKRNALGRGKGQRQCGLDSGKRHRRGRESPRGLGLLHQSGERERLPVSADQPLEIIPKSMIF